MIFFVSGGNAIVSNRLPAAGTTLVEAVGICKSFGHIEALRGVDFSVRSGEVVAVVGDNGSGKSTLIKILSGALQPDRGEIRIDGTRYARLTPGLSLSKGISTVYQDLSLDDFRDAAANIFLGDELTRFGIFLDRKRMRRIAEGLLSELNIALPDISLPVREFSGGQRQAVAVARALRHGKRLVIFDEPTAAMGVRESSAVLGMIAELSRRNIAVVVVSHNMQQVVDAADRVCIMRRGRIAADLDAAETSPADIQDRLMQADRTD